MKTTSISHKTVHVLDYLTDRFPVAVPKVFQAVYIALLGNAVVNGFIRRRYSRMLSRISAPKKILVIVDVNIGDAVMMQSSVRTLKACYPEAKIDYACNTTGGALVAALPEIHQLHNLFTQFMYASEEDLNALRGIINREQYDVIFNLCPFLDKAKLRTTEIPVVQLYVPMSAEIIRNWTKESEKIHLSFIVDKIIRLLVAESQGNTNAAIGFSSDANEVHGSNIYLTYDAIAEARRFLNENNLQGKNLLLLHSDAPFRYTEIPPKLQADFLKIILQTPNDITVLLSCGNKQSGTDKAVLAMLPDELRSRVLSVPRMTIPGYAALIDACDMYIAADTGTMHIAAAFKIPVDKQDILRNRTLVVGVYGATNSRMSAYDSEKTGHIEGMQHVPSKVFVAPAPCRNISCVAKPSKNCAEVRCFNGLTANEIAKFVLGYFGTMNHQYETAGNAFEGNVAV